MNIGEKIRFLREKQGFSQGEIAEHLGVKYQTVQKYEKNEVELKYGHLEKIAQFLGVSPSYFFEGYELPDDESRHVRSKPEPYAREIKMARAVLASKTHYAESLKMNILSFYKAMERERSLKQHIARIEKKLNEFIQREK